MKSIVAVTLIAAAGLLMSANAGAVSWKPECAGGQTLEKPHADLYRCKVRAGNRTVFRRASCAPQTPNLRRRSFNGFNYSCGLNTGVIGTLQNTFACPGGWTPVRNATRADRTCSRRVPNFNFVEPRFRRLD